MTDLSPRVLTIKEAAAYVRCKNVAQFRREVSEGKWPNPLPIASRPQRWDKAALDRTIDKMSGVKPQSEPESPWDRKLGGPYGKGRDALRP